MKFFVLTALFALTLGSAIPNDAPEHARLQRRADNSAAILASFKNDLEPALTQLDVLIKQNPVSASNLQKQEQKVEGFIKTETNLATSSSIATVQESTNIYNEINNGVKPKIFTAIDDAIARKGTTLANLKSLVRQDLVNLKDLTQKLGNALVAKAQGPAKTNGPALIKQITDKIQAGINAFT